MYIKGYNIEITNTRLINFYTKCIYTLAYALFGSIQ